GDTHTRRLPVTPRWIAVLEIALVCVVFAMQAGWPTPDVNEPHYIGKARHYWDPSWAADDFFFQSADTHLVFYLTCGWITRCLSLSAAAWVGRTITWLLIATAWQRLCQAVVGRPGWAAFSAALFLAFNVGCHLAGEWVVGGFEAKGLAYALVFAALTAFVEGRWNLAFLLLGGASAFHVLVGGWSVVALGLCWIISHDRPPLGRLLPGIVGGALLAAPGVVPALALNWGVESQIVAEANDIYVFRRLPHHLVPNSFRWPFIVRYLAMLLVWLALAWKEDQPLRVRHINTFTVAALAISLAGMVLSAVMTNDLEWKAAVLRYYWFRLADVITPASVALMAAANLAGGQSPKSKVQSPKFWWRAGGWLTVCTALVVYGREDYAAWRLFQSVPRADKSDKVLSHEAWRDVCLWMAENTPRDALAITPRMAQSFTWYSGRGQVVSWKDLPQDAEDVVRWWQRLEDIYGMPHPEFQGRWHESLAELSPERLRSLGQKYHADYLVVESEPPLALPRLYGNEFYVIYRLEK
ncbi:MAG TPA: DUF6798 domain-containing protein, partial [Pirellulales bacterium]|nr:DUF6798 domain-containing protein [Pirellulales bacterium]